MVKTLNVIAIAFYFVNSWGIAQNKNSIFISNASIPSISERWDLDKSTRKGTFLLIPHRPTYLSPIRWGNNPNKQPINSNLINGQSSYQNWSHFETAFQISFKTKIIQDTFFGIGDIWVAFTQNARWQVFAQSQSRPFRELNYEPEIIYNIPINWDAYDFKFKMIGVGFNHQSNGREAALSRSWNRIIFQLGMTYHNLTFMLRPWFRIYEDPLYDDNYDIEHYMGYGDATIIFSHKGHMLSLWFRNNLNFSNNKGFAEFSYAFPVKGYLKFLIQASYGYGESLIDYNHKQGYIGFGFSLTEWL